MNKIELDPQKYSEQKYDEVFESTYAFLTKKKILDLDKEIKMLETTIDSLMIYSGNDWTGRGESASNRISAQLAATETLLIELKEAKKNNCHISK